MLKADRLAWLCTDPAAAKLVPSHGIWLRGANIDGKIDLYRSDVPFSLTFYDCLFADGLNIEPRQAAGARHPQLLLRGRSGPRRRRSRKTSTCSRPASSADSISSTPKSAATSISAAASPSTARTPDDIAKQGVALNFHDAKVGGDIKLGDKFRACGQVRLIGTQIGRSLTCGDGKFTGGGQIGASTPAAATIGSNAVFTTGFRAEGGVELRRSHIGGDLDCDGGRFIAADVDALNADLVRRRRPGAHRRRLSRRRRSPADQRHRGRRCRLRQRPFPASGRRRPEPRRRRHRPQPAHRRRQRDRRPTKPTTCPPAFSPAARVRLWGTQVNQDILASGGQFEAPAGTAILACNLRVASRVVLTGVKVQGTVNLFSADIEHELDLRGSQFDGRQGASARSPSGPTACTSAATFTATSSTADDQTYDFRVDGLTSFQFATIGMHWDLYGAQLSNPGGDALDASDCRVGGYVNLDTVAIDGRASFSRAKIDGMWILNKIVEPEKTRLDMRFAHIWVIKDERLDDWPPAGQLQLEGLVYDHFDDDSPLDVNDRLAWLRRQYAPRSARRRVQGWLRVSRAPASPPDRRLPDVSRPSVVPSAWSGDPRTTVPTRNPRSRRPPDNPRRIRSPPRCAKWRPMHP